ncbi:MAG: hypothetical protein IPJ40_23675 [Saprospirales bacterium]|nr:hypothetical protein [Saprospirales bacterium]
MALESTPAAGNHLLLITDANVFLEADTIRMLARHLKILRSGWSMHIWSTLDKLLQEFPVRKRSISR